MENENETAIIHSPLEQRIEGDGTFVEIHIYRGEGEQAWLLEVVDELGTSTVYNEPFDSDRAALDEVLTSIETYGIRVYLEDGFPDEAETLH